MTKGEMTTEKAIDVMSDTGFFSPASCYTEEEQIAALYLAIRILEEKAEEEAKMQEEERTVYVERDDVLNAITETEGKAPATETTGLWAYCFCPVCHQALVYKQNYCSNCGQKITWTN